MEGREGSTSHGPREPEPADREEQARLQEQEDGTTGSSAMHGHSFASQFVHKEHDEDLHGKWVFLTHTDVRNEMIGSPARMYSLKNDDTLKMRSTRLSAVSHRAPTPPLTTARCRALSRGLHSARRRSTPALRAFPAVHALRRLLVLPTEVLPFCFLVLYLNRSSQTEVHALRSGLVRGRASLPATSG